MRFETLSIFLKQNREIIFGFLTWEISHWSTLEIIEKGKGGGAVLIDSNPLVILSYAVIADNIQGMIFLILNYFSMYISRLSIFYF